jgi:lycopene cyclase domain-containing protein
VTYLQFHLVFILPPLAVLAVLAARRWRRGAARWDPVWAFWLLPVVALIYTTPWDNYLVWRGVWVYSPGRVLGTVGYVPVEEYAFFLLQPLLTGLWYRLVRSWSSDERVLAHEDTRAKASRGGGAACFGVITLVGVVLVVTGGHGLYLGLILAWSAPVLAGMWALAGEKLWRHRRALALAVLPPTLYLWVADRLAIGWDVWTIADTTRTGVELLGLPVEEALFFLVTNLLVVQGLVMFAAEREPVPR